MNLAARILGWAGWRVEITVPDLPKVLICVAPHTSNWDFILGKLAYAAVGRKAGFLMKETWFFWPLGPLFRSMGGVPVPRRAHGRSLTEAIVERFRTTDRLTLAITPEGTRSRTAAWHTGFLRIAREADVPIELGVIDYKKRFITIKDIITAGPDIKADLRRVKDYYRDAGARYPEKFTTEDE